MNESNNMNFEFNHQLPKKTKSDKDDYKDPVSKKDRTIKIPKLYEYQFFDNFEEL